MLVPSSVVFRRPAYRVDLSNHFEWWAYVPGASWLHPWGPESSIDGLDDHPVVHVNFEDATGVLRLGGEEASHRGRMGARRPRRARRRRIRVGGRAHPRRPAHGQHLARRVPDGEPARDGFEWTAPVRSFPPNGYGLYQMAGNVWEWTSDFYEARHRVPGGCCGPAKNPRGGVPEKSLDPALPGSFIPRRVTKGGSFLCAPNYCRRYRPAARMAQPVDTSTCHLGFRAIVRR